MKSLPGMPEILFSSNPLSRWREGQLVNGRERKKKKLTVSLLGNSAFTRILCRHSWFVCGHGTVIDGMERLPEWLKSGGGKRVVCFSQ